MQQWRDSLDRGRADGGLKSPKIEITGEDSFHLSLTEVVCAPDVHLLVNVRVSDLRGSRIECRACAEYDLLSDPPWASGFKVSVTSTRHCRNVGMCVIRQSETLPRRPSSRKMTGTSAGGQSKSCPARRTTDLLTRRVDICAKLGVGPN